ncbi:MAG: LPS export ABC transporter periplasmic protein LptC [Planctomycetota bacterium]
MKKSIKPILHFLLLFSCGFLILYFLTGGFPPLPKTSKNALTQTSKIDSDPIQIITPQGTELSLPRMEIENAKTWYYDKDAKQPLATIHLKSARAATRTNPTQTREVFLVECPKITVFREGFKDNNLGETRITADRGELNQEYNKGILSGNVIIQTADPKGKEIVITTHSLAIDIQNRTIQTLDPVFLSTEQLSLEGVGLSAGLYINEAIINKNVVLTLKHLNTKYLQSNQLLSTSEIKESELMPSEASPILITCSDRAVLNRKNKSKNPEEPSEQDIQIAFYEKVTVVQDHTQFLCDQLTLNAVFAKTKEEYYPIELPSMSSEFKFYSLCCCGNKETAPESTMAFCQQINKGNLSEEDPTKNIRPISLYGTGNVKFIDEKGMASADQIYWKNVSEKQMQLIRLQGNPQIDFSFDRSLSLWDMDATRKEAVETAPEKSLLKILCRDSIEYHRYENNEDIIYLNDQVLITRQVNNKIENQIEAQKMELKFRRIGETQVDIQEIIASKNVYIKDTRGEVWGEHLYLKKRGPQSSTIELTGVSRVKFQTESEWSLESSPLWKQSKPSSSANSPVATPQLIDAKCDEKLIFEQVAPENTDALPRRRIYLEKNVQISRIDLQNQTTSSLNCNQLDLLLSEGKTSLPSDKKMSLQLEQCLAQGKVYIHDVQGQVFCEELAYSQSRQELSMKEQVKIFGEPGEVYCDRLVYDLQRTTGVLEGDQNQAKLLQTIILDGKKVTNRLEGNTITFTQKDSMLEQLSAEGKIFAHIYPKGELQENFLPKHLAIKVHSRSNIPWIVNCEKLQIHFEKIENKEAKTTAPQPQKIIASGQVYIRSEEEIPKEIKGDYFVYDGVENKVEVKSDQSYQTLLRQGQDYLICQIFTYENLNQKISCLGGTKTTFAQSLQMGSEKKEPGTPRPIAISCKNPLIYSGSSNQIIFEKEVHIIVEQDEMELNANKMLVTLDKQQEPIRIEAFGEVRIRQKELIGKGDQAVWDVQQEKGSLIGNVEINQNKRFARGKKLVWDAKNQKAILTGDPAELSEDERSRQYTTSPKIIFYPEENRIEMEYFEICVLPKGIKFNDHKNNDKK